MTLSERVVTKAVRLHESGHVVEIAAPRVFAVQGDHGQYVVVVANGAITCTCKATGTCAHIAAAGIAMSPAGAPA